MQFRHFLHGVVQALEDVLDSANAVLDQYSDRDVGDGTALAEDLLARATTTYKDLGMSQAENEMRTLRTKLQQARAGVDPRSGLHVPVRRRQMQQAISFEVVREACSRWRLDHAHAVQLIDQLRDRMRPLIEFSLEAGLLGDPRVSPPPTQAQLEGIWRALTDDAQAGPAARQVTMTASLADIQVVFRDLVDAIWAAQALLKHTS